MKTWTMETCGTIEIKIKPWEYGTYKNEKLGYIVWPTTCNNIKTRENKNPGTLNRRFNLFSQNLDFCKNENSMFDKIYYYYYFSCWFIFFVFVGAWVFDNFKFFIEICLYISFGKYNQKIDYI